MEKLLVLVSGGRSSAMMARWIQTSNRYDHFEKLYVFCNTSQERPETITFLENMVDKWRLPLNIIEGVYSDQPGVGVSYRIVDFNTLKMDGSVFADAIRHLNKYKNTGVPCAPIPYCSEYLKKRPSEKFAKAIFGTTQYKVAIGYRYEDMPKRISFAELKEDKRRIAPLLTDFDTPVNKNDVAKFFRQMRFDLSIPSGLGNCELCWKKSDLNLIKSIRYGTRFIDWHRNQEQIYGNRFFRENKSIDDLVKLAQSNNQLDLFSANGDSCVCSF